MVDSAKIERASARALPSRERVIDDGWWLRCDDGGVVRRANAVFAEERGLDPLPIKVERAEAWYAARGLPTRFQLSPASAPAGLADALRSRGYRFETTVQVLQRSIGTSAEDAAAGTPTVASTEDRAAASVVHPDGLPGLRWSTFVDDAWLAAYATTVPASEVAARVRLAATAPAPRAYAGVGAVACGMAVLDAELVGLFDLATAPAARRAGHATAVTASLLAWGARGGARRAYLQVAETNGAARSLYERLGFRLAYRYVYAVGPASAQ
jgi:N-acetylglutamate synthase